MKVSSTQTRTYTSKLYRAGLSTYQACDFSQREKTALHSIGIEYLNEFNAADILVTNTHTDLKQLDQDQLRKVKLIIHPNSGYDNFSPSIVSTLGVPIILGNSIRAQAVATYILSCFYHSFSTPPFSNQWDSKRSFDRKAINQLKIQIIGFGHIAKIVQKALEHLVEKISIHDPYQDKNEMNMQADCIIMACSLNKSNDQMINSSFLSKLNQDCVFINAARGGLVNIEDLTHWLQNRPKAMAYLDVFEPEPFDFSLMPKNSFKTSHVAGVDQGLDQRIIDFVVNISKSWMEESSDSFKKKWSHVCLSQKIINNEFI